MILRRGRMTIVLSLMLAVLVGFSGLAAPVLTDVSKDHWAYQAVIGLVDKGYLSVYNDGSFRGDEPVSRYLLAFVVAKMLTDLEKGTVTATEGDMSVLRQVSNELRAELVPLLAVLDSRVKDMETASSDVIKQTTAERQERKAEAAGILDELEEQAVIVKDLGVSLGKVEASIIKLEGSIAKESEAERILIEAVRKEGQAGRSELEGLMSSLKEAQDRTSSSFTELEFELSSLRVLLTREIEDVASRLTSEIGSQNVYMSSLEALLKAVQEKVSGIEKNIGSVSEAANSNFIEQRTSDLKLKMELDALVNEFREKQSTTKELIDSLKTEFELKNTTSVMDIERKIAEVISSLSEETESRKKLEQQIIEELALAMANLNSAIEAESVTAQGMFDAIRQENQISETDIGNRIDELNNSQARTQEAVNNLEAKAEKLITNIASDMQQTIAELVSALGDEVEQRKKLETEQVSELIASMAKLKAAFEAETAAFRRLIDSTSEQDAEGRAQLSVEIKLLRASLEKSEKEIELLESELAKIKIVLGQDIEDAVRQLSDYLDKESRSRLELDSKLQILEESSKTELKLAIGQLNEWAEGKHSIMTEEFYSKFGEIIFSVEDLKSSGRTELEDAIGQLSILTEAQHLLMAQEFDSKLGEVSSSTIETIEALSTDLISNINELSEKMNVQLKGITDALNQYSDMETAERMNEDNSIRSLIKDVSTASGDQLKEAITGVMVEIGNLRNADKASETKLSAEIAKLRSTMLQEDDSTRLAMLRNTIELQNSDSELEKSIADLRLLMDEARLGISQLKDRMGVVESRLSKLEGSVDILKANMESAAALLNSVNTELNRQKVLQGTIETKLADLSLSTDAKFKKMEKDNTDLMEAQDIEAKGREAKLNQKVSSLEQSIAEQAAEFDEKLKKATGLGITGLVIGALGLVVGIIVAIFLPATP